jgi:hypothetical protein
MDILGFPSMEQRMVHLVKKKLGPYNSGEEFPAAHTWVSKELFTIMAIANVTNDTESG